MKLEFSAEAAERFGFCQAILSNGQKVSYTNFINDEFDKPEVESNYGWKDKKTVYSGKDSDVISYDLSAIKKPTDPTFGMRCTSLISRNISELRDSMLNIQANNTPSLKK